MSRTSWTPGVDLPHAHIPDPPPPTPPRPNRYDAIDTSALEEDNANIFGNVSEAAGYKYLLSLEGHSYWYSPDTCHAHFRLPPSSHPLHSLTLPYTPLHSLTLPYTPLHPLRPLQVLPAAPPTPPRLGRTPPGAAVPRVLARHTYVTLTART